MHLLVSRGADPSIRDAQGFNTLHLTTHSSAIMPLLYMLQQPVVVDEKDSDGHTALMWAAYQGELRKRALQLTSGDALSVDLLIRHGASVKESDNAGLTPLHWAVVKGSVGCIKRIVEAGGDFDVRDNQNKAPRDMAVELKGEANLNMALDEANYYRDGHRIQPRFSDRFTLVLAFALPVLALFVSFKNFEWLDWWYAWPLLLVSIWVMQLVS